MKRLFVLILVLSLLLCACGEDKPVSEVTPQTNPTTEATAAPTTEPTTEPTAAPTTEPTTEPTTAPTTEPAPTEADLSFGRIEGGVYTNTYAGIGCEMNTNWSFYSAEELQELPELTNGVIKGSELGKLTEKYTQFFDMQAENVTDLLAVNVVYVKIGMQERLLYAVMSEEQTIDEVLKLKDLMIQSYAQAGIEVTSMEKTKVMFMGEEHYAIRTEASTQGIPIYMVQIGNYKLGAYGMTLTATSYLVDKTQNVLDMFYPVE